MIVGRDQEERLLWAIYNANQHLDAGLRQKAVDTLREATVGVGNERLIAHFSEGTRNALRELQSRINGTMLPVEAMTASW